MTAIVWDKVGERRFEMGIDRGVLYPLDGSAVAWNGLTSITEDSGASVKPYYIDGVKFLDRYVPGDYSAKLQAYTYPDEMDSLLGDAEFAPGVFVHDQNPKMFSLSYRTRVGNDLEGVDYAYKVHIVYNLTALRGGAAMNSLGGSADPAEFEFDLTGVPPTMFGIRPTCHLSLDSRRMDPDLLLEIENIIYGTPDTDPLLPDAVTLLGMVEGS